MLAIIARIYVLARFESLFSLSFVVVKMHFVFLVRFLLVFLSTKWWSVISLVFGTFIDIAVVHVRVLRPNSVLQQL